ncbi:MAG: proline--tRNA ligase, partial [Azoarcus sp.]|jgi:prolyl-tRNA synthetase|nr:proline--tRNA ligase [Azoarcus sp.]
MYAAYRNIFDRIGLVYRAVAADTGAIGGDRSHEFQVIADTGEDALVYCPDSDYAANIELAEALPLIAARANATAPLIKTATPGREACSEVADFLGVPVTTTVKSLVLASDELDEAGHIAATTLWLLLVRGDHDLNELKASKIDGLKAGFRFATETEIIEHFGCKPGYLGPIAPLKPVRIVADRTVANMSDFICGANAEDHHITGVNWGRDLPEPEIVADIRNAVVGDPSPDGKGVLAIDRGIEVGHVFYLGDKYSRAMNATFLDVDGKPRFFEMGCYGIGVTRILGAAIEQNNDARGILWPAAIAPFEAVVCAVGWGKSEAVRLEATRLYEALCAAGVDAILDDRDERPGVMFADWELIGVPFRLTVGERGLKEGIVEVQSRQESEQVKLAPCEAAEYLVDLLRRARASRKP